MHPNQQLRDLMWAVGSRSLVANCPIAALRERSEADARLFGADAVDQDHLAAFLAQAPSHRVGRYFERLILYWLKYVRRVDVVAESLQLREGNRTVGEIDLLFYDEQHQMTHWEIAVKFYLHFPHPNPIDSDYIGPNAADTFERKMQRLFDDQLPRSESHFPDVKAREAVVRGRIFYHPQDSTPTRIPAHLSRDHLRGIWIRSSEINTLTPPDDVWYRILHKPFWLAEEEASVGDPDLLAPAALEKSLTHHFAQRDHPVLISRLAPDGASLVETERIFVVSESWPA